MDNITSDKYIRIRGRFASIGTRVTTRMDDCRELSVVENAGPSAVKILRVLDRLLEETDYNNSRRRNIPPALKGLAAWAGKNKPDANLLDFSRADIDRYLETISNNLTRLHYRGGLRAVYDALLDEGGLIEQSPVVRPPGISGALPVKIPQGIIRLNKDAKRVVIEFMDTTRRGRSKSSGHAIEHQSILIRFVAWAEQQYNIYDLGELSIGDGRLYLASLPTQRARQTVASCLHGVFESLVKAKIMPINPFPLVAEDQPSRDSRIIRILSIAKNTGTGFEDTLRRYLSGKNSLSSHDSTSLNHFAAWLLDCEKINRFTEVTTEHLLRYRAIALASLSKTAAGIYFSRVSRFFKYLHAEGALTSDPAGVFGYGQVVKYELCKTDMTPQICKQIMQANKLTGGIRRSYEVQRADNLAAFGHSELPYRDRLMVAKIIWYVEKLQLPLTMKNSHTRKLFLNPKAYNRWAGGPGYWEFAEKLGVMTMEVGAYVFTPSFVAQYNALSALLKKRAREMVERHDEKTRLYARYPGEQKQAIRPSPAEISARQVKPAPIAAAA